MTRKRVVFVIIILFFLSLSRKVLHVDDPRTPDVSTLNSAMRVDHLKLSARRYNGTYACHMATDQPSGRGLHRRFRQSFSLRIFRTQRSLFLARSFDIVYDFRYRPLSEMFFVANIILFSFFAHGDWEQWYACDNVKKFLEWCVWCEAETDQIQLFLFQLLRTGYSPVLHSLDDVCHPEVKSAVRTVCVALCNRQIKNSESSRRRENQLKLTFACSASSSRYPFLSLPCCVSSATVKSVSFFVMNLFCLLVLWVSDRDGISERESFLCVRRKSRHWKKYRQSTNRIDECWNCNARERKKCGI